MSVMEKSFCFVVVLSCLIVSMNKAVVNSEFLISERLFIHGYS